MKASIFYSWQANLPTKTNRNFLENGIKKAAKMTQNERGLLVVVDRDTKGMMGSPSIIESIYRKIDNCQLFVCDVSFIGSNTLQPNANVLVELGYAIKTLGWKKNNLLIQ